MSAFLDLAWFLVWKPARPQNSKSRIHKSIYASNYYQNIATKTTKIQLPTPMLSLSPSCFLPQLLQFNIEQWPTVFLRWSNVLSSLLIVASLTTRTSNSASWSTYLILVTTWILTATLVPSPAILWLLAMPSWRRLLISSI